MNPFDDVLVFLYKPNMGAGYNTSEDYYYTLGLYQGLYFFNDISEPNNTEKAVFINRTGQRISRKELIQDCKKYDFSEKSDRIYTDFVNNLNLNLENKMISVEEYNRFLKETAVYATRIN